MHPTLLIGLDGATWTVLDDLMEKGVMPFLKSFTEAGVKAGLNSTPNPLTPPAWTTIMTGRTPGNHGIFDFIFAEQRKSDYYFTLSTFNDIKTETIWSLASRLGGRATTLNYPLMSPPPPIEGTIVPGLVSWRHLRRHVFPRERYDELKQIPGFDARELAWDFDMEKKAAQGIGEEDFEAWAEFHMRRERQWFNVAKYLLKHHRTDLFSILFDGPDKMMHMGWRFVDPVNFPKNPTDFDLKMQKLMHNFFAEVDGFMQELVDIAGPQTRVVMVSDHGFGPTWEVFRVNTWLAQEGYLTWRTFDENMDEKDRAAFDKVRDQHFVLLDWDKTTAYARSTTSNGIYIQVSFGPDEPGVPVEEYFEFRERLIERLATIKDPQTGERIVTDALKKEVFFPGNYNDQAPDLTLVLRDHSFVSILDKEPFHCARPQIDGTHYPVGIFAAGGPGIKQGARLSDLEIVQVAPAVLHSLGMEIPSNFEGVVPESIFEAAFLETCPVRIGAPTLPPLSALGQDGSVVRLDAEEEAQLFKQMQALGYME